MKLSAMAKSAAKHVCVFGPPKLGGKTMLVGKLANAGFRLFWFDLENGRTTLYQLPAASQERIEMFAIPDTKDYPIAAETMMVVMKGGKTRICNEHGKASCAICLKNKPLDFSEINLNELGPKDILVVDSLTQLSNSIMSHIGRNKDDLWKPEWSDYRTQGSILDRFLSTIQNAPYHAVVITHESSVSLEDGKERLVPVAGTSNFSRNTAKYFDEVVYCEVKNRRHIAASSSVYAPNVLTGSRTGVEIEKDAESSLLKIFLQVENVQGAVSTATTTLASVRSDITSLKEGAQK